METENNLKRYNVNPYEFNGYLYEKCVNPLGIKNTHNHVLFTG